MKRNDVLKNGIPVSLSLNPTLEANDIGARRFRNKSRMFYIMMLSVCIALIVSVIAKLLVHLIDLFTNIAFYGRFSFDPSGPSGHHLGLWVIVVPAIGGLVVGLMALFGSRSIRGHGIPEAMEQVLTNESKIKPAITFLKPLSAAVSIGTGGPFGAEGPIIATGGALGSTIGQILHISPRERKVLLAAGATAGMSAIFGSPVAAVFLAIELLLFEFSPRSILPVVLACITGAAGHHFLFENGPVFNMQTILGEPSNVSLLLYSLAGIIIGLFAVITTQLLYLLEDLFEKLPIHWMWWPAIGGLFVGIIGVFNARSLGVGYENITDLLRNSLSIQLVISLCIFKFISWVIALASGTSGGTLAPLLTIGGGVGAICGYICQFYFPGAGVSVPMAALVGMSAMFAGASRALMTSIIFALETTHQSNALLPLLAGCAASYLVSFFFMENTIMTEKIARRGVSTPNSYEPDVLEKTSLASIARFDCLHLTENTPIKVARDKLTSIKKQTRFFVLVDETNHYCGIIKTEDVMDHRQRDDETLVSVRKIIHPPISSGSSLKTAAAILEETGAEAIAVLDISTHRTAIVTHKDIISAYAGQVNAESKPTRHLQVRIPRSAGKKPV